jgi:hypothetical protein
MKILDSTVKADRTLKGYFLCRRVSKDFPVESLAVWNERYDVCWIPSRDIAFLLRLPADDVVFSTSAHSARAAVRARYPSAAGTTLLDCVTSGVNYSFKRPSGETDSEFEGSSELPVFVPRKTPRVEAGVSQATFLSALAQHKRVYVPGGEVAAGVFGAADAEAAKKAGHAVTNAVGGFFVRHGRRKVMQAEYVSAVAEYRRVMLDPIPPEALRRLTIVSSPCNWLGHTFSAALDEAPQGYVSSWIRQLRLHVTNKSIDAHTLVNHFDLHVRLYGRKLPKTRSAVVEYAVSRILPYMSRMRRSAHPDERKLARYVATLGKLFVKNFSVPAPLELPVPPEPTRLSSFERNVLNAVSVRFVRGRRKLVLPDVPPRDSEPIFDEKGEAFSAVSGTGALLRRPQWPGRRTPAYNVRDRANYYLHVVVRDVERDERAVRAWRLVKLPKQ